MKNNKLKEVYKVKKEEIKARLKQFSEVKIEDYFYELVFCLLTPQSNAEKCWQAVEELKKCGLQEDEIAKCLKTRTRFYKNKTKYIVELSKKWEKIEDLISGEENPISLRKQIVANVKGLGMKEASHFLRNVGKSKNQLAILDRHILKNLKELKIIEEIPNLSEKNYLEIEKSMINFSKKINIPLDELDLLFWSAETGKIFK